MAGLSNLSKKSLAQFAGQFRDCVEEVCDQAVISNLEDRCFFVFVDCHDDLGVLHASKVLDRAGDADSNIKIRCDDLASLADLPIIWRVTTVYCCT